MLKVIDIKISRKVQYNIQQAGTHRKLNFNSKWKDIIQRNNDGYSYNNWTHIA